MKRKQREVFRKYRCGFWSTALIPFAGNAAVFMSTSYAIQLACSKAYPEFDALLSIGGLSDMIASGQGEALMATPEFAALDIGARAVDAHALAAEALAWCPSLVLPDPTFYIPLAVGVVFLLNVELGAVFRARMIEAPAREAPKGVDTSTPRAAPAGGPRRSAAPPTGIRRASTAAAPAQTAAPKASAKAAVLSGAITRALRVASLAIVYFAGTGPTARGSISSIADHTGHVALLARVALDERRANVRAQRTRSEAGPRARRQEVVNRDCTCTSSIYMSRQSPSLPSSSSTPRNIRAAPSPSPSRIRCSNSAISIRASMPVPLRPS